MFKKIVSVITCIFIQILILFTFVVGIILWQFRTTGERDLGKSQFFTNLDWDGLDIHDIPMPHNFEQVRKKRGTEKTFSVRTNSQGLREDYEYTVERLDKSLRIAVVGDSVTFGEGVNLEDTYVKQFERLLSGRCHSKVEVINFGASGASTINELELIQRKVLLYKPDVILLQMDANDSAVISQIKAKDPFLNGIILQLKKSDLKISAWLKLKLEFYKYYRYRKDLTVQDQYNNVTAPLREIITICRDNKIKLAIVSYDEPYRSNYYSDVLAYIRKEGIPLLDLTETRFGKLSYEEKYVNPALEQVGVVDSHPNERGSRIMAEEIAAFFMGISELQESCVRK